MKRHTFFALFLAAGALAIDDASAAAQAPGAASGQEQTAATSSGQVKADEPQSPAPVSSEGEATLTSTPGSKALGISILGNQEAPTSLVIVPWKSSELGTGIGNTPLLDDSRQPVDKDVFMRSLRYYEISTGTTDHDGVTASSRGSKAAKK